MTSSLLTVSALLRSHSVDMSGNTASPATSSLPKDVGNQRRATHSSGDQSIDSFLNSYLRSINPNPTGTSALLQKAALRADSIQAVLASAAKHQLSGVAGPRHSFSASTSDSAAGAQCVSCAKTFASPEMLAVHACISSSSSSSETTAPPAAMNGRKRAASAAGKLANGKQKQQQQGGITSPEVKTGGHQLTTGLPPCFTALTMDGKCVVIDSRSLKELNTATFPSVDNSGVTLASSSSSSSISTSGSTGSGRMTTRRQARRQSLFDEGQLGDTTVGDAMEAADALSGEFGDICDGSLGDTEGDCDKELGDDSPLDHISEEAFESLDNSINWSDLLESQLSGGGGNARSSSSSVVKIESTPSATVCVPATHKITNGGGRMSLRSSSVAMEAGNSNKDLAPRHQQQQQQLPDGCFDIVTTSGSTNVVKRFRVSRSEMFVCPVCGQAFPSDKYLTMHMPIHVVEHPTENFLSGDYREHQDDLLMPVTSGVIPVSSSGVKVTMSAGGNSSAGAANWSCKICNKVFAQNSNYKNHMRTHSDERPFVCDICRIGFKERYHLKKHQLFKHSSELKEKCRVCGKLFKDSTAVRAHERIHSDVRPYSCKRCGKTFKTSECLWHHENRSKTCTSFDTDAVAAAALAAQTARSRKTRVSSAKPPSPPSLASGPNAVLDRPRAMTFSGRIGLGAASQPLIAASAKDALSFSAKLNVNAMSTRTVSLVLAPSTFVSHVNGTTQSSPRIAVIHPLSSVAAASADKQHQQLQQPIKITPIIAVPKPKIEPGLESTTAKLLTTVSGAGMDNSKATRSKNGYANKEPMLTKVKVEPEGEQDTVTSTVETPSSDVFLCQLPEVEVNTSDDPSQPSSPCSVGGGGGKYACTKCGKQFTSASGCEKHMLTHEESRPYRCALCDVGFKLKVHLKKHNLYRHSDVKPCACSICGKAFKDSSAVRLHEKIHSSQRPFICCCGKTFKTKENLWGHRHRGPCEKARAASLSDEPNSPSSAESSPSIDLSPPPAKSFKIQVFANGALPAGSFANNTNGSGSSEGLSVKRKTPQQRVNPSTQVLLKRGSGAVSGQQVKRPVPGIRATATAGDTNNILPPFESFASCTSSSSSNNNNNGSSTEVYLSTLLTKDSAAHNALSTQAYPTIESLLRLQRSAAGQPLAPGVAMATRKRTIATPSTLGGFDSRSQSPFACGGVNHGNGGSTSGSSLLTPLSAGGNIILPSPSSPGCNRHVFLVDTNPMMSSQEPSLRSPRVVRAYDDEETFDSAPGLRYASSFTLDGTQSSLDPTMPSSCWPDDDIDLGQIDRKAGPSLVQWQSSAESLFQEYVGNYSV